MSETFRPEMREAQKEHIPSKEEVLNLLGAIIDQPYKETNVKMDENGLYQLDVEVPGEKPGEVTEYVYRRGVGGPQKEGKLHSIAIVYYEDGMPVGGKTCADCTEGVWEIHEKK